MNICWLLHGNQPIKVPIPIDPHFPSAFNLSGFALVEVVCQFMLMIGRHDEQLRKIVDHSIQYVGPIFFALISVVMNISVRIRKGDSIPNFVTDPGSYLSTEALIDIKCISSTNSFLKLYFWVRER